MAKLRLASSTASAPEIGYNDRVILPMRIFKKMSVDDLVIGAVEKAFTDMVSYVCLSVCQSVSFLKLPS